MLPVIVVRVASRAVVEGALPSDAEAALLDEFSHRNGQRGKLKHLGLPYWHEPAILRTWRRTRRGLSFPRGGLDRIRAVLEQHGLIHALEDRRTEGDGPRDVPDHLVELWPHQEHVVGVIASRETCLVRAPAASGKSTIALAFAARMKLPLLVIVKSGALADQWRRRAAKELDVPEKEIGFVRGAKRRLAPVTVAMQQTLTTRGVDEEMARYFGIVVFDEMQGASSATAYAVLDQFPARYRIGISESEKRADGKQFLIYDVLGDVAVDVPRGELVEDGHILDAEVRVVPSAHLAPWYGYGKTDDASADLDFDRLLAELARDDARNDLVLGSALAEAEAGEQVLVLSHRREHCQHLAARVAAAGARVGILIGGADHAREFERAISGLRSGELRVGVGTYQAVGTGVDLPRVGVAVCATPIAGNKQFYGQVRGRVCRAPEGKSSARLVYIWDAEIHPGHLKNLCAWNEKVLLRDGDVWRDARAMRRVPRKATNGG